MWEALKGAWSRATVPLCEKESNGVVQTSDEGASTGLCLEVFSEHLSEEDPKLWRDYISHLCWKCPWNLPLGFVIFRKSICIKTWRHSRKLQVHVKALLSVCLGIIQREKRANQPITFVIKWLSFWFIKCQKNNAHNNLIFTLKSFKTEITCKCLYLRKCSWKNVHYHY